MPISGTSSTTLQPSDLLLAGSGLSLSTQSVGTLADQIASSQGGTLTPDEVTLLQSMATTILDTAGIQPTDQTALTNWLNTLSSYPVQTATTTTTSTAGSPTLQEQAVQSLVTGINSTDPNEVYTALLNYTSADTDPQLTDAQRQVILGQLTTLSQSIAGQNASGGIPGLESSNPTTIETTLETLLNPGSNSSLSASDITLLQGYLTTAAQSIGSLNGAAETPAPVDPLYTEMNSANPTDVYNALSSMIQQNEQLTPAQLSSIDPMIQQLADTIASQNAQSGGVSGLDSTDPTTLDNTLTSLLGFENNPLVPADTQTLLTSLVQGIATQYASVNQAVFTEDTYSTDPQVIYKGLVGLSNLEQNPGISSQEYTQGMSYLLIMAQAIGMLSAIRAKIVVEEAEFKNEESKGKLANTQDQTTVALSNFNNGMTSVTNNLNQQLSTIAHQQLMSWLMPLITAAMAVVAIVITIATMGIAAPAVAIALIAVTVALTTFTIVNQQTNFVDNLCTSAGITNPVSQAAINLGFQVLILIVVGAATFGAAVPALAAGLGVEAAEVAGQITSRASILIITSLAISTIMSSGIVTAGVTAIAEDCGADSTTAMWIALAVSIALMIASLGAIWVAGRAAGSAAEEGTEVVEDLSSNKPNTDETGPEGSGGTSADGAVPPDQASELSNSNTVTQMLQNVGKKMKEILTDAQTYVKLFELIAQGANVANAAQQATYNFTQAELLQTQADITKDIAAGEALITELQTLAGGFDINLKALNDASTDYLQSFTNLLQIFDQMASSANTITTNLTNTLAG